MRICAYDEVYLQLAQRMLGDMFDYAVNLLRYDISAFYQMFIVSGIAHQVEIGNPMYIAGMNGCEVAKDVIESCGLERPDVADEMMVDKSPEYWIGWALAYYQWLSGRNFSDIEKSMDISEMYKLYPVYHELDIEAFVEVMDERSKEVQEKSQLCRLRKYAELSQSQLSKRADVPIRQIQLFEQGQRDINKTQGETLVKLARAIGCDIEDVLEN